MINFYFENKELINNLVEKFGIGRDQTILNFMLRRHKVDIKLLPYKYNMTCMMKKEILGEDMLHTKVGYVMHFNGIPDKQEREQKIYKRKLLIERQKEKRINPWS